VRNLLGRRVENESPAKQDDHAVKIKIPLDLASFGKVQEGILQQFNEVNENKEEHNPQSHRNPDPQLANPALVRFGRTLGLQRNVKQVIEAQNCLKKNQKPKCDERI
jgi:hypothetical protein